MAGGILILFSMIFPEKAGNENRSANNVACLCQDTDTEDTCSRIVYGVRLSAQMGTVMPYALHPRPGDSPEWKMELSKQSEMKVTLHKRGRGVTSGIAGPICQA